MHLLLASWSRKGTSGIKREQSRAAELIWNQPAHPPDAAGSPAPTDTRGRGANRELIQPGRKETLSSCGRCIHEENVGIFVFLNFYVANRLDVRKRMSLQADTSSGAPTRFSACGRMSLFSVCWEIKPVYSFEAACKCHQQSSVQMGKGVGRGVFSLPHFADKYTDEWRPSPYITTLQGLRGHSCW